VITEKELKDAFNEYTLKAHDIELELYRKGLIYARHEKIEMDEQPFIYGFHAGAKWMQEKIKEALKNEVTLETVPCECHLFKNRVCDFCQGIRVYAHIKKPDNAVLK
jgi:hypothetical protein